MLPKDIRFFLRALEASFHQVHHTEYTETDPYDEKSFNCLPIDEKGFIIES